VILVGRGQTDLEITAQGFGELPEADSRPGHSLADDIVADE
jgi:hypothetical protein